MYDDEDFTSELMMSFYGSLAQRRLAAGLKLNLNEATAILTSQVGYLLKIKRPECFKFFFTEFVF